MSISVENLVKRYGSTTVVHGISFEVEKGEFVSLLGPSGCGKTTTLRCIAGLEEANDGVIQIGSDVVSAPAQGIMRPPHERNIGMVFQSYAIWPHMSVLQNVGFPLSIRKVPAASVRQQAEEALDVVGMLHLKDRAPSQLSGGQQQRVALARAIVGHPSVLLFDEPLSNLDAKLREATRGEIRRIQRKLDIAAVYVTHDQEEALSMSDRVIVMEGGRIMQAGSAKELYRRPDNRFVADFVGRASFIDVIPMDGGGSWRTGDGTPIEVESVAGEGGGRYQLMVRPEAVGLFPRQADRMGETGANRLPGTIEEAHYMGAYTEYHVRAGECLIKVHSPQDFGAGEDVTVAFSSSDCRLIAISD
jgi:ABC-type Fe3+/spermidine/putrescine transport system ATPase subunit